MEVLIILLVLAVLAVARITRLLVEDRLTVAYRRWTINRWGENSLPAYLVHCPWCMSIWIAALVMPVSILLPYFFPWLTIYFVAALAIPAASFCTGLLTKLGN
jgi:hypothetical protein